MLVAGGGEGEGHVHHHLKGSQRRLCPLNLSCGSGKASARLQALCSEQPTSRDTVNPVVLFQDLCSHYSRTAKQNSAISVQMLLKRQHNSGEVQRNTNSPRGKKELKMEEE